MPEQKLFHSMDVDATLRELDVSSEQGLSDEDAQARQDEYGPNQVEHAKRRNLVSILIDQFKSVVIIILALAGIAALVTSQWTEAIAIAAVVVVNTAIGFFAEYKATRSMEALRDLGGLTTRVRRSGKEQEVQTQDLVPGDIVLLEAGDLVPADLRLLRQEKLRVNEAALTGESVPANKTPEPVNDDAPLADRTSCLFKGTSIADGSAVAVVMAIGSDTELGQISKLAGEAESSTAPLQERLDQLGRYLAYITIGVAIVVAVTGLAAGRETRLMIETSIALGVAAIPEGLPIVATIALARGMWIMAQRHALVNRLTAVETLGATRVIFTDKTGTLTENRMRLHMVGGCDDDVDTEGAASEQESQTLPETARHVVRISVLCNGASLGNGDATDDGDGDSEDGSEQDSGDPTEIALLAAGRDLGLDRRRLLEEMPEQRVVEFDPSTMMMATYHQADNRIYVAVKGAPRRVLDVCDSFIGNDGEVHPLDEQTRDHWVNRVEKLADQGLRVLAVADKTVDGIEGDPYEQLCMVGLVGLLDPPRHEVKDSINRCQAAGIRVLMVTGDEPTTGRAIGRAVGIGDEEEAPAMHGGDLQSPEEMSEENREQVLRTVVFARVSPEQKLNLVEFYQQRGEPVAMTGDGVNDAPALKKADIGIAMGKRGTDAAKQTADMVLQDDSFGTIVAAVEQGRIIFGNIRKSVVFMLCTNVAEILAVTIASLIGAPLPLLPLQILYLNVVTDVFPALALGIGRGRPEVMNHPPRSPDEAVLTRHHWTAIVSWSVVIAAFVMSALMIAMTWLGYNEGAAITVSFLTLAFAKLWFVLNLRDHDAPTFKNDITQNGWLWAAVGLCIVLLLVAVYLPGLSDVLHTVAPNASGWAVILLLSLGPAVLGLFAPGIQFHSRGKRSSDTPESPSSDRDKLPERVDQLEAQVHSNRDKVNDLQHAGEKEK